MSKTLIFLFMICTLCLSASAQVASEPKPLVPGQPVEREIAGGEEHTYRIALGAGQFMRLVVEPKGLALSVSITSSGGKPVETNHVIETSSSSSISLIADSSGEARLTAHARGASTINGSYRLRVEVRTPTADDRKRINAEQLLKDGALKAGQGSTAQQANEILAQALVLWRELGDRYFEVRTLYAMSRAYTALGQHEKSVEYSQQTLAIARETKDREGQFRTLNLMGVVYSRLSRQDKAIESLEQALVMARELNDRNYQSRAFSNLVAAYNQISRYDKSLEYGQQAVAVARELDDKESQASARIN